MNLIRPIVTNNIKDLESKFKSSTVPGKARNSRYNGRINNKIISNYLDNYLEPSIIIKKIFNALPTQN